MKSVSVCFYILHFGHSSSRARLKNDSSHKNNGNDLCLVQNELYRSFESNLSDDPANHLTDASEMYKINFTQITCCHIESHTHIESNSEQFAQSGRCKMFEWIWARTKKKNKANLNATNERAMKRAREKSHFNAIFIINDDMANSLLFIHFSFHFHYMLYWRCVQWPEWLLSSSLL